MKIKTHWNPEVLFSIKRENSELYKRTRDGHREYPNSERQYHCVVLYGFQPTRLGW